MLEQNGKGGPICRHIKQDEKNMQAAKHPPRLVRAILKATAREYREGSGRAANAFAAGPVCEETEGQSFSADDFNDESQDRFWDDANGGWLDPVKVAAARQLEVDWIKKRNVLKIVKRTETKGKKLLDLRWVDTLVRWNAPVQTRRPRNQEGKEGIRGILSRGSLLSDATNRKLAYGL